MRKSSAAFNESQAFRSLRPLDNLAVDLPLCDSAVSHSDNRQSLAKSTHFANGLEKRP
uniref:Uncharacterized protein n=1 Tax=Rhizobium rhizogenes TaxID=359 RepID=A0A7S4ZSZ9_RHIRH|nr:hypothetical protein pC5.8d_738 [Rhizobium rhizogenes]